MQLEGVDVTKVSKLITQLVDSATCDACCKFYVAPKRATCGHILCNHCWYVRKVCMVCQAKLERKLLKLDTPKQLATDNARKLAEAFEQLFEVSFDQSMMDTPEKQKEEDPTKNVKEWLTSSENHFSAPPFSETQQSTQDILPPVQLSTSKIQIHAQPQGSESLKKVMHVSVPQDDWDKIEVVTDTQYAPHKDKENIIGPKDFEPFSFEDSEFSNEHPRRSNRKKVTNDKKQDSAANIKTNTVQGSNNSSLGTDKKFDKTKQTWSNVKKIKKEFSKQIKGSKTKLNVSIEMCKKNQSMVSKQNTTSPPTANGEAMFIDDDTPNITDKRTDKYTIQPNVEVNKSTLLENENFSVIESEVNINPASQKHVPEDPTSDDGKVISKNYSQKSRRRAQNKIENKQQQNELLTDKDNVNVLVSQIRKEDNIPFIKMSKIQAPKISIQSPDRSLKQLRISNEDEPHNSDDDIHISIRFKDLVTNITINNKEKDVKLKVNTDRVVQTSLGPSDTPEPHVQPVNATSVSVQTDSENKSYETIKTVTTVSTNAKQPPTVLDKTTPNRKNTASASTATAPFVITESVEKELSSIKECDEEITEIGEVTDALKSSKSKTPVKNNTESDTRNKVNDDNYNERVKTTEKDVPADMNLDDIDIFNSGSVKEHNVQMLKNSLKTPLEILVPTHKSSKSRTQKKADKRNRESDDIAENSDKRQKVDTPDKSIIKDVSFQEENITVDSPDYDQSSKSRTQKKADKRNRESHDIAENSDKRQKVDTPDKSIINDVSFQEENITLDSPDNDQLMGQVFANIDADIDEMQSQKLQCTGKKYTGKTVTKVTQVLNKTQQSTHNEQLGKTQTVNKFVGEKYSENMFSTVGNVLEKGNTHVPGPETQQNIANLLTPGMCSELAAPVEGTGLQTEPCVDTQEQDNREIVVLCTPIEEDDSDKSVVEETPQKDVPVPKTRNDSSNSKAANNKKLQLVKPKVDEKKPATPVTKGKSLESQDSSIINLTDSVRESTSNKNVTKPINYKETSTPLTIHRFVDVVTHKSTPMAKKSLKFVNIDDKNSDDEENITVCPTDITLIAETTKSTPMAKKSLKFVNIDDKNSDDEENITVCPTDITLIAETTKSTPMAKKSLKFVNIDDENSDDEENITLCPTDITLIAETTKSTPMAKKSLKFVNIDDKNSDDEENITLCPTDITLIAETTKSTPMAKKSLKFVNIDDENSDDEENITLCPTDITLIAETTQEKQFMKEAFENQSNSSARKPLVSNVVDEANKRYCIAGSCLSALELTNVKILCFKRKWTYVDKYRPDLTHLVVSVDEENRSQRTVKYMCAVAAGKWIISYKWVEKCLEKNIAVNEEPFEPLDSAGIPGPRLSRLAGTKLFDGFTFCCLPPFSMLEIDTLVSMLEAAGGRVVMQPHMVRANTNQPCILLCEPEHTQEGRYMYLALELGVVPVNYEWALNCLGVYSLCSLYDLLLCPAYLLPKQVQQWPPELMANDDTV